MLSVGADVVIDYTREDFAKNGQRYDRILDVAGRRPIFDDQRSLTETGSYVIVGGAPRRLAEVALLGAWLSRHRKQSLSVMGGKPNQGLDFLVEEFEAGKLLAALRILRMFHLVAYQESENVHFGFSFDFPNRSLDRSVFPDLASGWKHCFLFW